MKKNYIFILVLICFTTIKANNIIISNVSLSEQNLTTRTCKIKFDVTWDNSWRNSSIPGNWDAAWIFIKARQSLSPYQHVNILDYGYSVPNGATMQIPADRKGFFLYRSSDGSGNVNFTDCTLLWDYGQAGIPNDATIELKVFAIEMVYVPQGSFKAGDNATWYYSGGSGHYGYFKQGTADNEPWNILGEDPITTTNTVSDGYYYNSWYWIWTPQGTINSGSGEIFTIPDYFPKGYNSVYCMKYEISQQQYTDFLNSLDNQTQQNNRIESNLAEIPFTNKYIMSNSATVNYRNSIACSLTPNGNGYNQFFCDLNNNNVANESDDGHNIACNFLKWPDVASYLDWAALRPMTELEFEKICRGPNEAVGLEFAWGTSSFATTPYSIDLSGSANEIISGGLSNNTGNASLSSTSSSGPLRCGIFAASTSNPTRMITGATYYGVMEMSGNVTEFCVSVGNVAGRAYNGQHGDGLLNPQGHANVDYWPGINGNTDHSQANTATITGGGVTASAGIGWRGGSIEGYPILGYVSNRVAACTYSPTRTYSQGGRGVRSAP